MRSDPEPPSEPAAPFPADGVNDGTALGVRSRLRPEAVYQWRVRSRRVSEARPGTQTTPRFAPKVTLGRATRGR